MLIVFFLECGHENQEGGHINFQAEHRSISGRTKKSRNNKSSCIAERQAVLVSWTHPEKGGIPPDFRCSGNSVAE